MLSECIVGSIDIWHILDVITSSGEDIFSILSAVVPITDTEKLPLPQVI